MNWHQLDRAAVIRELKTDSASGLNEAEAERRLASFGRNELAETGTKSPWRILWEQLTELMVVILMIAAVISALLGDYKDSIAIAVIVALNAILGFNQEYRAEKAMAALQKLAVPSVRVRRDGQVREIPALLLVPGDLVLFEAGNFVAADCRVVESADLQIHEAALTGESEPVRKTTNAIVPSDVSVGDRHNMAYMGTFVTGGHGQAVVTDTGMRTELGRIATLIQTVTREPTPLQRRMDQLGKGLAAAALFLVAAIFGLGWLRGTEIKLLFLTAVSVAVAAVPEGLPAVVTIALTLGAQRMLKRQVLIRKLPAVETLGSVTVICSDKTGTLTQNRMTAAVLQLADEQLNLAPGSRPAGGFGVLLAGGALCNDVLIPPLASQDGADDANSLTPAMGDPTELALAVAAARFGLRKPELERILPRVAEVPFSSERKRMTTIHRFPSGPGQIPFDVGITREAHSPYLAFTKGAVDRLLNISQTVWIRGKPEPLDQGWRDRLTRDHERLAKDGMRVLGVAFRWLDSVPAVPDQTIEQELTFVGMIGIIDPPRSEAAAAVAKSKAAGIRAVMITGDHPLTAQYIARQIGITSKGPVLTGPELDHLSMTELELAAESVSIYARVSPGHKLNIIEGFQRRGHIVAMTGDGVNDAPALKKADIGLAMGLTGTDVAKQAADMVLLDDNFATIVDAVEEGRIIYDNIRKFIKYILASNLGEIGVMLAAPLLGMPLPLLPLQILWMNLVTDGLPALALAVEPPDSDTMNRPPHPPDENIFSRGLGRHVIWVGLLIAFLSLGAGYWYWRAGDRNWQSLLFTTLTMSQMANVMAVRSERQSLFQIGLLSNKPLLGAVSLTVLLQFGLLYVPLLQDFFRTSSLPLPDLALAILLSTVVFVAIELEKWNMRRKQAGTRRNAL